MVIINKVLYERLKVFLEILYRGYLTPKRVGNIFLCLTSEFLKNSNVLGMPFNLMLEPTNLCNLSCPACPCGNKSDNRKKGCMEFKDFKIVLNDFAPYLINMTFWNYGEPFMHKDAIKMIRYAKTKNVRVVTSTNGHFFKERIKARELVESKLDRLIIALDGASQETLTKYRINSNFSDIEKGIRNIVEMKRKLKSKYPVIEIQFIIMGHNEHEIGKIQEIAKLWGVDTIKFKTVDLYEGYNSMESSKLLPSNLKMSRYKLDHENKIVPKNKIKNNCSRLWYSTVIDWDGTVVACCHDPYCKFKMGNFFEEGTIRKIWNNGKYISFRKAVLKNKKMINICKNCPADRSTTYKLIKIKKL